MSSSSAPGLHRSLALAASSALVLAVTGVVALARPAEAASTSTFAFTGAEQAFVVPAGVTRIRVDAVGASGAAGGATSGGAGARVQAELPVTPGQTLYVEVGGDATTATGGFNGGGSGGTGAGGGGGATDLRTVASAAAGSLGSRLIVAAGGGGGGSIVNTTPGGDGGDAGTAGSSSGAPLSAGGPGTATAGGAGAGMSGSGTSGSGGSNAGAQYGGGGGGGGYFGGGAGNTGSRTLVIPYPISAYLTIGAGGGGGGSSYVTPSATAVSTQILRAAPSLTISYDAGPSAAQGVATGQVTVTIPDTLLGAHPASSVKLSRSGKKKSVKATFGFSATVPGSSFECRIDSAAFTPCVSTTTYKLKKGSHLFAVRAVDAAGADPTPATYEVKVKKKKVRP